MKTITLVLIAVSFCVRVSGQFQELEQLRLDLEKLAQFKIMLSEMKSGYTTLLNGYNAVRDAGKANFNLHQNFLDGLLKINPAMRNNPAVQRVGSNQQQMAGDFVKLLGQMKASGVFTTTEINNVISDGNAILDVAGADADLLLSVLTPGTFRMSDGERSEAMNTVDQSVSKQAVKMKELIAQYNQVMALRLQQKRDNEVMKRLGN